MNLLNGTFNAYLFHLIIGFADASRIDETELDSVNVHGFFDGVACGTMNIGNDGAIISDKLIEERRFADVCFSDDSDGDALFKGLSCFERLGELGDVVVYLLGKFQQLCSVGKFEVFVVGEIEFEFEQGCEFQQLVAEVGESGGQFASQLVHRQMVSGLVGGGDEVGYGFGLGQVEFAIEVGTHGEFTRIGHATTILYQEFQHLI